MKFYLSGTQLGQYEIVIGPVERPSFLGGMGIVYLGFDRTDNRPVALKTFQPQFLPNRYARERFLREGQTWGRLEQHPNIVQCFQVTYFSYDQVYLILEQVAADPIFGGPSLRDCLVLSGGSLPFATALLFALQVARGMAYAVEKIPGLVHRDLKPDNILIGADKLPGTNINRVRVTDFGLVTALTDLSIPTEETFLSPIAEDLPSLQQTRLTRGWAGTPPYMAPEQWLGNRPTAATDIYAFGLILQEMLTGRQAILGRSLSELQAAHIQGLRQPLPNALPISVADLITHCTDPQPDNRYQTWEEVEIALTTLYKTSTNQEAPPVTGATELSLAERSALGWGQNNLGMSYRDIGKLSQAANLFEQVVQVGQDLADRSLQAAGLGNLGATYREMGQAQQAISYLEQHLVIAREIGDRAGEGNALGNLGATYAQFGEERQAISYLEKQLWITRELGDRTREGLVLGNLGAVYGQFGNLIQAISYLEKQVSITKETGDRVGEGRALGNLGVSYLQLGNLQTSISYLDQALTIARETGDRVNEGKMLGNLGITHLQMGNVRQAIDYDKQFIEIALKTGDKLSEAMGRFNLALAYAVHGDTDQALVSAEAANSLFLQIGHTGYAQQTAQLLSKLRH